jgi:acetyltransferase-like isoleucine patch superfamily enzyme
MKALIRSIKSKFTQSRLRRLKKSGLQIADDCRIHGMPFFGTEPYLISIGKGVTLSGGIKFLTHDGATWVFRNTNPRYRNVRRFGRITIHDGCFVGFGAIFLPDTSVGRGSVVAAGAVVTKHFPEGSVVAGVPAKVICSVEEYAEKLLAENKDYDEARYKSDKKAELLRLFPYPWEESPTNHPQYKPVHPTM